MAAGETLMERRKSAAIEEIARVALELCARDGFEATNVQAIAEAAGCSPRTFYRYFGTKEDVLFHDLPAAIEQLRDGLDGYLSDGMGQWSAVCAAVVDFIRGFDVDRDHQRLPRERMQLWLTEPALRGRYLEYVNRAEEVVADCLCRHRGTTAEKDDLAQLMAVAAIGATRVSMLARPPGGRGQSLAKHLQKALDIIGGGLEDASGRPPTSAAAPRRRRRAA